jgi:cell division protein FtsL
MMRFLHIAAIAALVASAVYVYSIKYDTIFLAEQVAKLKARAQKEKETIAVLQAEWQRLNRPERLQALADRHLGLQPLTVQQIVRFADLPQRQPKVDEIGRKLETLGLGQPTATPQDSRPASGRTPSTPAAR